VPPISDSSRRPNTKREIILVRNMILFALVSIYKFAVATLFVANCLLLPLNGIVPFFILEYNLVVDNKFCLSSIFNYLP